MAKGLTHLVNQILRCAQNDSRAAGIFEMKVINQGSEEDDEGKGEPGGTLLDISLTDVLHVLSVNRKTCTLFLKKDEERGAICLKEGKIVDAKTGDLRGEQALFYLLDWEGADFFIGTSVEGDVQVRIEKDLHSLILGWIDQRDSRNEGKETKPETEETVEEKPKRDEDTFEFLKRLEASGVIKPVR